VEKDELLAQPNTWQQAAQSKKENVEVL